MLALMSHSSPHPCACGCGGTPSRGQFLRGHFTRVAKQTSRRDHDFGECPDSAGEIARPSLLDRPVGRLLVAVFEDALEHRAECPRRQAGLYCQECAQDRRWALATAASWVYSFVSV